MSENAIQSLPASWYVDDSVYQLEQTHIFGKNWIFVAPQSDLTGKGDYVSVQVAGRPVILVNVDGEEIKAFYNLCRHRASPLCQGQGNKRLFTCPYHSWSYNLDGVLINTPGFDSINDGSKGNLDLLPVRVTCWNSLVFVCLSNETESLLEWLGDVVTIAEGFPDIASMQFANRLENFGDVNWKTYSDNSAEGYHLDSVHKELSMALVADRTEIRAYENGKFTGFDVTYKNDQGGPVTKGFWIYKFAGLLLHFSDNGFNIERVEPVAVDRTRIQRWFWFRPDMPEAEQRETIEFSNRVMQEDMEICGLVQTNLAGGVYQTGWLSPDREPGTIQFQQLISQSIKPWL